MRSPCSPTKVNVQSIGAEGEQEMTKVSYRAFTDAATGQTIYVNPYAVRFIMAAGHRTTIIFSETHSVIVTADLQSVIEGGLFEIG